MPSSARSALWSNFLGHAPAWYKQSIVAFLVINPIVYYGIGAHTATGWILVGEFIFTLAMALRCYPLQPGGLLVLQAVAMGMASPDKVREEVLQNFAVILLLMFMVAGIYFMRELLLFSFTKVLLQIRSKALLSVAFCGLAALLSAFLDALTVIAVVIGVCIGFYGVYHKVASGKHAHVGVDHDLAADVDVRELHRDDLEHFRSFLRSLLMHAAIGTALGGVCTMVGEPQNLLIAQRAGWTFIQFFQNMAHVTMPVLAVGLTTCLLLEKLKLFGYGEPLPPAVREILRDFDAAESRNLTSELRARLWIQAICALLLVIALAFHWAEVGLIGLMIIVLQTALNGVIEEGSIGKAFEEALPFTALLVVFFGVVAVIHTQDLFHPVIAFVLHQDPQLQPALFYAANGLLSAISDNVFVATIYINEVKSSLDAGEITRTQFDNLAVAINTGTNIPSIATPNGQAAFLFLLTSSLAPLIRLSYVRMVVMALPYTVTMTLTGLLFVHLGT